MSGNILTDPLQTISQRIKTTMICDPLTKAGPKGFADRLIRCMATGKISLEPTPESQLKKMKQQKARMEKALGKTVPDEATAG